MRTHRLLTALLLTIAAPPARADTPPGDVDLLGVLETTVAVSSTVSNPKYIPLHLVDGDRETAWNSRSGDLVGAWIAFRVPDAARVDVVRMTVGFTHKQAEGDLFTMNPRVRKVRVSRQGKTVAEKTFDVEQRDLQEIPIGGPGGDYLIEVLELTPGSKPTWREVCVSELQVWGVPPKGAKLGKTIPDVVVGTLDPTETVLGLRPGAPGKTTLPLAPFSNVVYLGLADADWGTGPKKALEEAHNKMRGQVALTVVRAADPALVPARYLAAKGMKVVIYDQHLQPKCKAALGKLVIVSEGITADAGADAVWKNPLKVAAEVDAKCPGGAWARGADLPPLAKPAPDKAPAATLKAARQDFGSQLKSWGARGGDAAQAKMAEAADAVYVPPAGKRSGYLSLSFSAHDCDQGDVALSVLWEVPPGKQPLKEIASGDHGLDLVGVVDIDGDGAPDVITERGEIRDGDYKEWVGDLIVRDPDQLPFECGGEGCGDNCN